MFSLYSSYFYSQFPHCFLSSFILIFYVLTIFPLFPIVKFPVFGVAAFHVSSAYTYVFVYHGLLGKSLVYMLYSTGDSADSCISLTSIFQTLCWAIFFTNLSCHTLSDAFFLFPQSSLFIVVLRSIRSFLVVSCPLLCLCGYADLWIWSFLVFSVFFLFEAHYYLCLLPLLWVFLVFLNKVEISLKFLL